MATTLAAAARPAVSFDRVAGLAALAAAALGLGYAVAFLLLRNAALASVCLMAGGVLATAVITALRARLADAGEELARWGYVLAVVGSLGATVHGGFDLANALHPPAAANADLPNAVDPRGLLTFGLFGLGLACFAVLMARSARFPRRLAHLGALSAVLSLALYLGRLVVLDPASPLIAFPALAQGFVVSPLWYAWLGVVLVRAHDARR